VNCNTHTNKISIHLDLLAAGLISDPFIGMNEKAVQWVHEKDWVYTCAFSLDQTSNADSPSCDLVFEGLDTFANVSLNGHEILK
jgi:beta-mannosidase